MTRRHFARGALAALLAFVLPWRHRTVGAAGGVVVTRERRAGTLRYRTHVSLNGQPVVFAFPDSRRGGGSVITLGSEHAQRVEDPAFGLVMNGIRQSHREGRR